MSRLSVVTAILGISLLASAAFAAAPQLLAVGVISGTDSGGEIDVLYDQAMGNGVTTPGNYTVSDTGKGTLAANPDIVTDLGFFFYRLTWISGEMFNGGDITITVTTSSVKSPRPGLA